MDYHKRVNLFILYMYHQDITEGVLLGDVPFINLDGAYRKAVYTEARKLARTPLLPRRKYKANTKEWEWVLEEVKQKKRGII